MKGGCCDLLKNSYLCLLNNTQFGFPSSPLVVVICWKIRIFAYWTTPGCGRRLSPLLLWFAEKFVSLLIEQHHRLFVWCFNVRCDLLKNSYLCLLNNTYPVLLVVKLLLWFAEKFVSLLIEQHQAKVTGLVTDGCDLLKNSYLCLLNNTCDTRITLQLPVVICWKIRIFAYWTTPHRPSWRASGALWFAEKFVSLLIEQHQHY